ncbi:hypothetical protein QZH41_016485 [Actinostola sp. cb2023]|nr:hypothetical protein QZH41_016485 [Actinostola sp. cb2023]
MKDKLLGKSKKRGMDDRVASRNQQELWKLKRLGPRKFRKQATDFWRSLCLDGQTIRQDKQTDDANDDDDDDDDDYDDDDDDDGYYYPERESRKRVAEDSKAPWEEEKEKNTNALIESYTKQHRGESLMDMHQKELKKKRKEEGIKPNERRPFDRDKDLGYTTVDPSKRKSLLKKSKELDTRFHRSKTGSTFL